MSIDRGGIVYFIYWCSRMIYWSHQASECGWVWRLFWVWSGRDFCDHKDWRSSLTANCVQYWSFSCIYSIHNQFASKSHNNLTLPLRSDSTHHHRRLNKNANQFIKQFASQIYSLDENARQVDISIEILAFSRVIYLAMSKYPQ